LNDRDAIIVKYDIKGNRIWSTYYGGSGWDTAGDLAFDSLNNIYVFGTSSSNDVLGNGGFQEQNNGEKDAFIAKFDLNGYRTWGTFYGGKADDNDIDISSQSNYNYVPKGKILIDKNSDIIIASNTRSDSFL
jgi:hypothetical protein